MRHSVQLSTFNVCATIFKNTLYFWILPSSNTRQIHEQSLYGSKTNLTSKNMDFQEEFLKWKPQNNLHYGSDHLLLTHRRCLLLKSGPTWEYPEGFITLFVAPKTTVGLDDISLQAAIPGRWNQEAASLVHFVSPCFSFYGELLDVSCLK